MGFPEQEYFRAVGPVGQWTGGWTAGSTTHFENCPVDPGHIFLDFGLFLFKNLKMIMKIKIMKLWRKQRPAKQPREMPSMAAILPGVGKFCQFPPA
jgi:hypothetical protein